ncbi:ABC-type transport system permease protein [Halobacterium hubeiense]|jgi:ABC-2 type transport system permease protein|uniref:ABC-type transport system permease protein n=2 Tax=Halobacterium TaxID=2239 RepID=A0A0U5HAG9_9EURY|nr:ABC transporter permease [Halobacterium hubeiense]CQH62400.1 ABC-type transport system permease protein [Halobacterium hubeiense]
MSWAAVAKKDFQDAARSKALWALAALFVLFMAGAAWLYTEIQSGGQGGELAAIDLLFFLLSPAAFVVPITGLVIGHKAIAGELESGSAKFLLSLPHTRRDAVLGKVAGRGGVIAAAIVVGLVAAAIVTLVRYDTFDATAYLGFSLLTILLGVTYTAIGVGLSAATKRSGRATILALVFFVVFEVGWGLVTSGIYYLSTGSLVPGIDTAPPEWYLLMNRVPPSAAFTNAVYQFLPGNGTIVAQLFPQNPPIYLSKWAALATLLVWLVVVPALGYYRFRGMDL